VDTLTRQYRAQSLTLRAQTIRDLLKLWPALDWRNLERTYPAWFTGAAALVQRDRTRSAGLASLYLKAHRLAAGVPGEPAIRLAGAAPAEQVATALRVTTLVAIKKSTLAGKSAEIAMRDAFVQSSGAATRLVLDAGRDTIRETAVSDPQTAGWQRVTSGGCDFCEMLAGRGDVYTEASADFASHDHCACSAEPVYGGEPRAVRAFTPSQRRRSDATRAADNARARAFIANS
jgi:hypothetical protein